MNDAVKEISLKYNYSYLVIAKSTMLNNDFKIIKETLFQDLIDFITRGPVIVAVLNKNNAVEDFRNLIGSTDPNKAEDGTIRKLFAKSVGENAIHGSDSNENAKIESSFHFSINEIFN